MAASRQGNCDVRNRGQWRGRVFTLIEVVVAVALLGVSLATVVTVVSQARSRVMRAERRWAGEHLLTNATEWVLLAGEDAAFPDEALPPGFNVSCVKRPLEDLPTMAAEPRGNWFPYRYTVRVSNANGESVGNRSVIKVLPYDG